MKNRFLFFALLFSIVGAACGTTPATSEPTLLPTVIADKTIIAEGRLEPIHFAQLALNASGLVSDVLAVEGQQVSAGDVIARLDASGAQTLESAQAKASQELTAAYQEVRDAQFKLDNFDVPSDFVGMTPAEAVDAMLVKLDKARADFEPYKHIDDRNLQLTDAEREGDAVISGTAKVYKKALDSAWAKYRKAILWLELESAVENANVRLKLAQRDYDALYDGSFAEETAGPRAALASAEVRAPFSGIVTDLNMKVGEYAASGQHVVTIADLSKWVVKTRDLTEIDVIKISEGQSAIIILDALPDVELTGTVLTINQNYSEVQGDIVYEASILLTEADPNMRWGMTAEVKFSE